MAELLPSALGWIDEKKRQVVNTITQALAEAKASPGEAALNALRGTGRGALSLGEMMASPMAPQAAGTTDALLPSNGSAAESVGEFLGPPLKMGAKLAGAGAHVLSATMLPAMVLHPNMDKLWTELTQQGGMSAREAATKVKYAWGNYGSKDAVDSWVPKPYVEPPTPSASKLLNGMQSMYNELLQKGHTPATAEAAMEGWYKQFPNYKDAKEAWVLGTPQEAPLPKIEFNPTQQNDLGLTRPPQPIDPLLAAHGLDPQNIDKIQQYTRETPPKILERFETAQRNATEQLGLPPSNTAQDRALALQYPDIGDKANWLMRGSQTPRAVLKTPKEAGVPSPNSPRQMDVLFASEPHGSNYVGYGPVKTPLVSRTPASEMFNPASLDHQDAFIKRFDELHPHDEQNLGITGREIVDDWKNNPGGAAHAWDAIETHPGVTATIKDLGFPGFRTYEHGENRAVFDPTDWRHPLAAFDPALKDTRNLFASWGPITALAGLLAAKGLPVQGEAPQ